MKKIKQQRGITLVALAVTIVILLILAGISISALTNQGIFAQTENAKKRTENAQIKEETTLADYENKIGEYVSGTREQITVDKEEYEQLKADVASLKQQTTNNVTISKEEYQELKDATTAKEIDFELTITPKNIGVKQAYIIGSEVCIAVGMDCNINKGTTIIGKIPEEYKPVSGIVNAVYLYSSTTKARVGLIYVDENGNVIIGNYAGEAMTQVNGTLRYRYK